jgi:asparagine synthase (glutamine-hydrolysing)
MCGIAAHLRFPRADTESVRRMAQALRHRGPDGDGELTDGPIALGHRRLSIIDLAGGAQPLFNEDRTVAVVLNGEIYNYRELAEELGSRHRLRTRSDTEVLVHLYEDHGTEMLSRLRGMFAFVLWDAREQRLLAARDRFGEKPLVYVHSGDALWIASELRALSAAGAPLGTIDPSALADYLSLLYVPAPRSIWTKVRKLPAGHRLVADARGVRVERYWSPPAPGRERDEPPDAAARARDLLEDSARLCLRSDVPVGVLLSGGLDSSVVTALAARASPTKLKTFSVGFGRPDDELSHAREVARRYGTEHREIIVQENVPESVSLALAAFSEPFGDSSAVPCAEVFRHVAREVKVVLTGDGGDELFAGYGRYRQAARLPYVPFADRLVRPLDRLPAWRRVQQARRAGRVLGTRRGARYRALVEVFSPRERRLLLGHCGQGSLGSQLPDGGSTDPDAALAADLRVYLPDDLLVKTDITSMASSLEARCPLLDFVLAEWVVPMPIHAKQDRARGKRLLEAATRDLLPPEAYLRPKRGFGSPVEQWLRGPLRALFEDTVMAPQARIGGWFDRANLRNVGREVLAGRGNAHQAWALLALEIWSRSSAAGNLV